jgi:probable HAF family extracellular repeat protein
MRIIGSYAMQGRAVIVKFLSVVVMLGLMLSVPSQSLAFTFTTIDVPGAVYTTAYGINAAGQIVGFFQDAAVGHGFVKDGATFTTIDVPGAVFTSADAINDAGQIVGTFMSSDGTHHGYIRDGAAFTTIDVPGAVSTEAFGINDAGQIVGTFVSNDFINHGFVKYGATFTTIDVPGAVDTAAGGINNGGQIVGEFCDATGCHGFVKDGATFTTIDVPGAVETGAFAINDAGQIVGAFFDGTGTRHGFVTDGPTFTTIDVPGAVETDANGINIAGQIVGIFNSINSTSPEYLHGFVTAPTVLFVAIDVRPGSFPNNVNLGSGGTVPVAILSSPGFDATTVDPLTITLASASLRLTGRGTPMASFQDVNGDSLLDLMIHVETLALQLSETDTQAVLKGQTFSGIRIIGRDLVRTVP